MQLQVQEFIRSLEQPILSKYFTKIRSYSYLSNRNRKTNIDAILLSMQLPLHPEKVKTTWHLRLLERY